MKNQFSLQYKATVGADFLTKQVENAENIIQLQLWDTAGTEKYHSMGSGFYRNSETCILVFDLTNQKSFENIEAWRTEFLRQLNPADSETYPFVLIGNKNDMKEDIIVSENDIENYCKEHNNMPYFSTSAKDNTNLEEAFSKVADLAYNRNINNEETYVPETKPLEIDRPPEKKKGCCLFK